jgi:hypothetical protein
MQAHVVVRGFNPIDFGDFLEQDLSRVFDCQPPLLAPSPLRTGLEGSHSSGSSTQKRPHEKRGRGLVQNESDLLDTDLLPIRAAVKSPSCVKLHQSAVLALTTWSGWVRIPVGSRAILK